MKHIIICAVMVTIVTLTISCHHSTGPREEPDGYSIPPGNYLISKHYYETAASESGDDTLKLHVIKCNCIDDALISHVIIEKYAFFRDGDTLSIQRSLFIVPERTDTIMASVLSRFYRFSQDTGINGIWEYATDYIKSTVPLSQADSQKVLSENALINWISITPSKCSIYYQRDKIPTYTSGFLSRYHSILSKYNLVVDSLSSNSLRLLGSTSHDAVMVSKNDTTGSVTFSITVTDTARVSRFKPNPYIYNALAPEAVSEENPTPCQEYPNWINTFLMDNPMPGVPTDNPEPIRVTPLF